MCFCFLINFSEKLWFVFLIHFSIKSHLIYNFICIKLNDDWYLVIKVFLFLLHCSWCSYSLNSYCFFNVWNMSNVIANLRIISIQSIYDSEEKGHLFSYWVKEVVMTLYYDCTHYFSIIDMLVYFILWNYNFFYLSAVARCLIKIWFISYLESI